MSLKEILENLQVPFDDNKTTDNDTIYLSEFDKLSADRSIVAIKEGDKYYLETFLTFVAEVTSPQLKGLPIDTDSNDAQLLMILIDATSGKVWFINGKSYKSDEGKINCEFETPGIIFLAYQFYPPITIVDEEEPTYKFIESPDLDSEVAYAANGQISRAGGIAEQYFEIVSNNTNFTDIYIDSASGQIQYLDDNNHDNDIVVYFVETGWVNEAYRTVKMLFNENTYNYFAYKWLFTNGNWIKQ